jgi:hypothetical protein
VIVSRRATVITFACLVFSACGGPGIRGNAEVDMRVTVAPEPPTMGPVMLTVAVTDLTWRPLNGAGVLVIATPPTETRESQEYTATGIGAGKYQVPNFPLDEVGNWRFTVRVDLAGGTWAEMDTSISVLETEEQ